MKFYTNGSSVYSQVKVPEHLCGWNQLVHGGVLSTILDEIMSWSAIYLLKQIPLTKSMTVDFIKPVYINSNLKAEGKVLEIADKHEAVMQGIIFNNEETICAKSTGKFAVFSPAVAKRLGIANEDHLKWFEKIYNI